MQHIPAGLKSLQELGGNSTFSAEGISTRKRKIRSTGWTGQKTYRKNTSEEIVNKNFGSIYDNWRAVLLQKRHALHASYLKPLAAAHVLTDHHVVAPQHIRLRFGELCPVAIVGTR